MHEAWTEPWLCAADHANSTYCRQECGPNRLGFTPEDVQPMAYSQVFAALRSPLDVCVLYMMGKGMMESLHTANARLCG